jgi:hypothetical protein
MFDFQKAWWSRSMLPLLVALVLSVAQCELLALKQTTNVASNLCVEWRAPTPLATFAMHLVHASTRASTLDYSRQGKAKKRNV